MNEIKVFMGEDAYLTHVVVQTVTKARQYISKSEAQWLIVSGQVEVDGEVEDRPHALLDPGVYNIRVGPNIYSVNLANSSKE